MSYPNDPFYLFGRNGSRDNPYKNFNEPLNIFEGKVILTEIPYKRNKVIVKDGTTLYSEVFSQGALTTDNVYFVDYDFGIVYFDLSHNGKQLTFTYTGEGYFAIPTTRIYSQSGNTVPTQNLQDMIDNYNQLNGTDLYTLFDPQTGHKHSGASGDAPPIDSLYITYDDGSGTITNVKDTLTSHNSQINDNAQKLKVTKSENYILVSSFRSDKQELILYISYDGVNFLNLNLSTIFKPSDGNALRDPDIMYWNNYFYICYTHDSSTGFGVARSTDLLTWEEWQVALPEGFTTAWAPSWYVENGNVYASVSMTDGTMETDITGTSILYFKTYYMKAVDTDLKIFATPVEIVFPQISNKIDSCIRSLGGRVYCFIKNEHNKTIEQYSLNGSIESGTWSFVQTVLFPYYVEGPCAIELDGTYYLYADGYSTNTTWVTTSTDVQNWGIAKKAGCPDGTRTVHFGTVNVSTDMMPYIDDMARKNVIEDVSFKSSYKPSLDKYMIEDCLSGNAFTPVKFGAYYVANGASGTNIVIDNIVVSDYNEVMEIYLCLQVASTDTTHSITLKSANNILTPNDKDFVISASKGNNEVIIKLVCVGTSDQKFRIEGDPTNYYEGWTQPTLKNGWVNYGSGYAAASYRRTGRQVEMKGLVKNGTAGVSTPIFTLPTGYRPTEIVSKSIITSATDGTVYVSWLQIDASGNVFINGSLPNGNGYVYLDCSFPIDVN